MHDEEKAMPAAILPFVHVQGSWGEMGLQVGQMFAPLIARHVDAWLHHISAESGCTADAALTTAATFAEPIQTYAPFLWEELEGMAQGSGVSVSRLLLLQARAEVMRAQKEALIAQQAQECTTFAVGGQRTANGVVLFGQNVDLVPFVEEFGIVVRQHPREAPATLLYTSAGLLGHNGMNEAAVGICANFINDPQGWRAGLPHYLMSRLALREHSAEAASQAVLKPPRAASRNLLIADAQGVFFDAELLCDEAAVLTATADLLVHANHLEAPQFQDYETPSENSCRRRQRLQELLEGAAAPITVAQIQAFYRDHTNAPHSLCAHPFPGRNIQTVVSVIGDLTAQKLYVAKGSPCRSAYATYTMATCRQGSLSVMVEDEYLETFAV
jgi:isopenicillin-N N-acyltransferase like protein